MAKNKVISLKISADLWEKIETVKTLAFEGNRTALVIKALSQFVAGYENDIQEWASPAPQIAEAALTAAYIRDVLLQGTADLEAIKQEVEKVCHLLN